MNDDFAELEVLGCIMRDPDALVRIGGENLVRAEEFYNPQHKVIAHAIFELDNHGRVVTPNALASHLNHDGILESIGGLAFIQSLERYAGDLDSAARRVVEHSQRRDLQRVGAILSTRAANEGLLVGEVIAGVEEELHSVRRRDDNQVTTIGDVIPGWFNRVQNIRLGQDARMTRTGIPELDALVGKLEPNDMMLIGGRPGDGKSTLLRYITFKTAVEPPPSERQACYIGDFEEGKIVWVGKMVSLITGIPWPMLRDRAMELTDRHMEAIDRAMTVLQNAPIIIESTSGPHVTDYYHRVRAAKRIAQRKWSTDLRFHAADYIQRMKGDGATDVSSNTHVSNSMRDMCQEDKLYVPSISTAQLSRMPTSSGRPVEYDKHHLRESGAYEQDATIVVFPIRKWLFETPTPQEVASYPNNTVGGRVTSQWASEPVRFKAAKVRNGATGKTDEFIWHKTVGRFEAVS